MVKMRIAISHYSYSVLIFMYSTVYLKRGSKSFLVITGLTVLLYHHRNHTSFNGCANIDIMFMNSMNDVISKSLLFILCC